MKKGTSIMRWPGLTLIIAVLILIGCNGNSSDNEPPPDPLVLLTEAADNIRSASTFRLEVTHSGAKYWVGIYINPLSDEPNWVTVRRVLAQYVAPEKLQAQVSIRVSGFTQNVHVYVREYDQWYSLDGSNWIRGEFAIGFNPRTLIEEDTGFEAAMSALTDLQYIGSTSLEDGTPVYHLSGTANGPDIEALLVGMVDSQYEVNVDVYIDRNTDYPVRLIIRQPETITEDDPIPTTWTVDIYDINAEPQLTPPEDS